MSVLKLKINKTISDKYRQGMVLFLKMAKDGLPDEVFWRNRLKDAASDNCVQIIATKKSDKKKVIKNDSRTIS